MSSKVRKNQYDKTVYYIDITDLGYNTKSAIYRFVNKKLNKVLEKGNSVDFQTLYISVNMNIQHAIYNKFENLREIRENFKTNEDCIRFLEEITWNNEPISPYDKTSKVYKCKDGRYKCKNTGKEFNILTGTLFQGTKIPLPMWFEIIFRMNSSKQGIASTTIARDYGISQKTAYNMLQKIRHAMEKENYEELSGIVETDEYYEGAFFKKHVLR